MRSSVNVSYLLARTEVVRAEVLDITGARVALLTAGNPLSAGMHSLQWDGRGHSGDRVKDGVYFMRISAGGHSSARILVNLSNAR